MKRAYYLLFVGLAVLAVPPARSQVSASRISKATPQQLARLQDQDPSIRAEAALNLANLNPDSPATVEALIAALEHEDPYVRRSAASALGELSLMPKRVVPALMDALRDEDEQVRTHAVIALVKLGTPAASALAEALNLDSVVVDSTRRVGQRGQTYVRVSDLAASALIRMEAPVVPALVDVYKEELERERNEPTNPVDTLRPSSEEIIRLRWSLDPRSDFGYPSDLKKLIQLIIDERGATSVPSLITFLQDDDPDVHSFTLDALQGLGLEAQAAIPALTELLQSSDDPRGPRAARVLGHMGPDALPALTAALGNGPNPEVRAAAASAFGSIDHTDSTVVSTLIDALHGDEASTVRAAAAMALRDNVFGSWLNRYLLLRSRSYRVRRSYRIIYDDAEKDSVDAVTRRAVHALVDALQRDTTAAVRASSAQTLGFLESNAMPAVSTLVKALKDTSASVQAKAAAALESIIEEPGPETKTIVPDLIEALRIPNGEMQGIVAATLGALGTDAAAAVPVLLGGLKNPSDYELDTLSYRNPRVAFIYAIGRIGTQDPEVATILVDFLDAPESSLRRAAESVLSHLGAAAEAVVPALVEKLKNKPDNEEDYSDVEDILVKIQPAGLDALLEILQDTDEDGEVRRRVCVVLSGNEYAPIEPALFTPLIEPALFTLLNEANRPIRECAAKGLARNDTITVDVLRVLEQALLDGESEAQEKTLRILDNHRQAAIPLLLKALADSDFPHHRAVINRLERLGVSDPRVTSALIEAMADTRADVREHVATALGGIGTAHPRVVPTLIEALRDTSADVRRGTVEALGEIGGAHPHVVPTLIEALQDTSTAVRRHAVLALGKIGAALSRVVPALIEALDDTSMVVRTSTVEVLGEIGAVDPRIVPALIEALADTSVDARGNLVWALMKIDREDPRIVPIFLRALHDPDPQVRTKAAGALGRLQPDNAEEIVAALVALLKRETRPGVVFETPPFEDGDHRDHYFDILLYFYSRSYPAVEALSALRAFGPRAQSALPDLLALLDHPAALIRRKALESLRRIGAEGRPVQTRLIEALGDTDQGVQTLAAEILTEDLRLPPDSLGPAFITFAIDRYIQRILFETLNEIADVLRPPPPPALDLIARATFSLIAYRGGGRYIGLPSLPWPPPHYTHIGVFGRDFPKPLLGADTTKLSVVYHKLYAALQEVDPNFESGLFRAPGGFAMLAKIERIQEDGTPYPGKYRWVQGKVRPLDLMDYIGRLFFEKPGYFRVIAFVVTTEENFGSSDQPLPHLSLGGTVLPFEVAEDTFAGKKCYVLIYSYERKRGGATQPFNTLSAPVHLEKSGILNVLESF